MLRDKNIALVWFSGTGGTRRAALELEAALARLGARVESIRICRDAAPPAGSAQALGVLFPVHAFHEPKPVRTYLETLPPGEGKPAFVLSVSGGGEMCPNTACRTSVVRQLARKGYRVDYEGMLVLPSNIGIATGFPLDRLLLDLLPTRAAAVAAALDREEARHPRILAVDRFLAWSGKLEERGARIFGRNIKPGPACTGCGLCRDLCPTGNIRMEGDRPVFGNDCAFCMGCIYSCPAGDLSPGLFKAAKLPGGLSIEGIAAGPPVPAGYADGPMRPGLAWSGVVKYVKETLNGKI
jgi:ferredoxin